MSLDEVIQSDLGRKIKEGVEEAAKTTEPSANLLSKAGEKLDWTAAFKAPCQGVESRRRWTRASRGRPGLPAAGEKFKEEKFV